ncbi:unnamed protein product [Blepharisma stoltei]|uniref:Uncharacterized protein n=1 Tax=Blepharisma stoltei TaxID=1481888 RepID=A0AAU9ILU0_9CILI|nr:unnamed protein product [Blepharisma stoltei]
MLKFWKVQCKMWFAGLQYDYWGNIGSLSALAIGQHNIYYERDINCIYHDEIKERMLLFHSCWLISSFVFINEIAYND